MSVNKVSQTDGSLAPIAGGTLYTDMPIGTWIKWDDQTNMPDGFLKYGDTITQAEYPELYAMYGATVPYKADKSELGAINNPYTISTNAAAPTIMPYDGFISFGYLGTASSSPQYLTVWVNGAGVFNIHHANGGQERGMMTIPVKKGDSVYCNNQYDMNSSRWYDKTLIVKAKQTALPTDFGNAVDDKIVANMIDSVTDGSQKAITSNAVFDQLKNFCMTVQASGSLTIEPNSQQGISLTYTCPQGYTPILAVPRSAGSWAWVWSYCYLQDTSHVYAVIRSVNSFQETQTISANVLCVRTYS